jgi:hypothetical protein
MLAKDALALLRQSNSSIIDPKLLELVITNDDATNKNNNTLTNDLIQKKTKRERSDDSIQKTTKAK